MDRDQLLSELGNAIRSGVVTRDEVTRVFDESTPSSSLNVPTRSNHRVNSSEVLYYIGGAIVFLGIAIMVAGSWEALSSFSRILATLGSGIVAYVLGSFFIKEERFGSLSSAFFLISALVLPIGLFTVYQTAGLPIEGGLTQILITFVLTAVFGLSYWFYRKIIFTLFTIIFSTGLFLSVTSTLLGGHPTFGYQIYLYQILVVGLSYLLLGYQFASNPEHRPLTSWLYSFGCLAVFGAALALGGWSPDQNAAWEVLFPGLVFGAIFLGIHLRSRSLLFWGAVFLMGYILKITAEYFSEGLGWPLALVIAGLSLIGVGYYIFYLNRKYLSAQ